MAFDYDGDVDGLQRLVQRLNSAITTDSDVVTVDTVFATFNPRDVTVFDLIHTAIQNDGSDEGSD